MDKLEFITVEPKVDLHIRDWGSGKAVVFLPGWPLGHEMFEYQFNQLPQLGYRCVGITQRGFGKSSKPWGEYTYDVFAQDLKQVLETLDLKEVTLVGHSMGGAVALNFVAKNMSERVSKLVLVGAATPSFIRRPGFPQGLGSRDVDDLMELCEKDRAQLNENFGKIFFKNEDTVSKKMAEWYFSMGMEASPQATLACLATLRDTDLRGALSRVNIPTLVFHSPQDKICPFALGQATVAGIKGARMVEFENSGHGLFYEEKEKFNQELIAFVNEGPPHG